MYIQNNKCDSLLKDNIRKPSKPHRVAGISDMQSEEAIAKRRKQIEKLAELGIDVNTIIEKESEDVDEIEAQIIIMQDKELPKDLEQRLLNKKKKHKK